MDLGGEGDTTTTTSDDGEASTPHALLLFPADPILLPLTLGSNVPSHRSPSNSKPRCGLMKVKIIQLLQMMICCRYEAINSVIVELGLLPQLWDLFLLHERNNTLHCAVTHATIDILEGTSVVLKRELLGAGGCNLVGRILNAFELNEKRLGVGESRLCYMGQLSMCAFELARSSDVIVQDMLSKVGSRWEDFNTHTLVVLAELDQQQLGDPVPVPVVEESQDHQMLLENLTAILSSLRLQTSENENTEK